MIEVKDPSGSVYVDGKRIPNGTYKPKDANYDVLARVAGSMKHVSKADAGAEAGTETGTNTETESETESETEAKKHNKKAGGK